MAGDTLTMSNLLDAVAKLRINAVPEIDGVYNCYLDPVSARQLFADPDFKQLFQGATSANQVFRQGMVNSFLGLRFIPTTEAFVQPHPTIASLMVRRPIICGQGALIEGDFAGMAAEDVAPADSIVTIVDDVAMVTREPIDRLQQIIAQSWYWIGGFCAPSDTTTNAVDHPDGDQCCFQAGRHGRTYRLTRHRCDLSILRNSSLRQDGPAMAIGSIMPFRPTGTVTLSASTTSASVALAGGGDSVVVTNM